VAVAVRVDAVHAIEVVRPSGNLDLATCSDVEAMLKLAEESHALVVVADLTEVPSIDETGSRVLTRAQHRLSEDGRSLIVRNPSDAVRWVLEPTGLTHCDGVGIAVGF
jgi:anti-anti-sigma factor